MPREVFRSTEDLAAVTATRLWLWLLWWELVLEHRGIDQAGHRFEPRDCPTRNSESSMLAIERSAGDVTTESVSLSIVVD